MPTSIPSVGYRALRSHRVSLAGHVYLVTTTTHERRRVFLDFAVARIAIRALNHAGTLKGSELLTWVLMPDHVHLLVQLGDEDDLSQFVNRVKSRIAREVNRHLGRAGPVWQCGFHEHLLRKEEDVRGVGRYIVMNPLRAGLVARVGQYSHWDAVWL